MKGFQPGNCHNNGRWAVNLREENITLRKENTDLRASLDEANAHLAWARDDGKALQRALEIMSVQAVRCDGCHYDGCEETDNDRAQCQRDAVTEAIEEARKEKG